MSYNVKIQPQRTPTNSICRKIQSLMQNGLIIRFLVNFMEEIFEFLQYSLAAITNNINQNMPIKCQPKWRCQQKNCWCNRSHCIKEIEKNTCKCMFQLSGRLTRYRGCGEGGSLTFLSCEFAPRFLGSVQTTAVLGERQLLSVEDDVRSIVFGELVFVNNSSHSIRRFELDQSEAEAYTKHVFPLYTSLQLHVCTFKHAWSENECYPVTSARWSEGITTDREDGKYSAIWLGVTCEGTSSTTTTRDAATKQRFETHRSKMTSMHQIKPLTDVWINSVVQYLINSRF